MSMGYARGSEMLRYKKWEIELKLLEVALMAMGFETKANGSTTLL
jgi:hypothetical protein